MPICKKCNTKFPNRILINNKIRIVNKRKFCIICSPFNSHNTIDLTKDNSKKICPNCKNKLSIKHFYKRRNGKKYITIL